MANREIRKPTERDKTRDEGEAINADRTMPAGHTEAGHTEAAKTRVGVSGKIIKGPDLDENASPGDENSPMTDSDAK